MRFEKGKLIFGEKKRIGYTERYEWGFGHLLAVLFLCGFIFLYVRDYQIHKDDPEPVYTVNPGSFPGKWLGKTVTINGVRLEVTGYNRWRNHFELSNGTVMEFSHPSVPVIYCD